MYVFGVKSSRITRGNHFKGAKMLFIEQFWSRKKCDCRLLPQISIYFLFSDHLPRKMSLNRSPRDIFFPILSMKISTKICIESLKTISARAGILAVRPWRTLICFMDVSNKNRTSYVIIWESIKPKYRISRDIFPSRKLSGITKW